MSTPAFWQSCLESFQRELTQQQFNTWIRPLRLELAGEGLRLIAPNRFVLQWVKERFAGRIEELAAVANLSPRQFSRAFLGETGQSPAKAVERLRLEAARFMIEEGRHTVNIVAQETGFADRERMRRAFLRTFGVPPEILRRNARREAVAAA